MVFKFDWLYPCEVIHYRRISGKIIGENTLDLEEMCLKKRNFRHHKGDIVDICYHPAIIHTSSTRVDTEANCEEQVMINP